MVNSRPIEFVELPQLRPCEIHVVEIHLDQPVARANELLDRHERERSERFLFERDRRRFVVAHAWMRLALGLCLNRAPDSLQFMATRRGKPQIVDAPVDVRFNLSHAGERGLLAIALQRDVGIDIEEERSIEVFELAERFFSPSEVAALRAVQPLQRTAAFFRCWTRKEAFVKAIGEGLFFPLNGFDVIVDDVPSTQLLRGCAAAPHELWRWRVVSLPTERPHWAALAARAGDWRVVRWKAAGRALHRT